MNSFGRGGEMTAYEVGRLVYMPGARPYMFYLVLEAKPLRISLVLSRLLRLLERYGVPVLQLKIAALWPEAMPYIVLTADLRGREELLDRLVDSLRGIEHVVSVYYEPPLADGLAVDVRSFPLRLAGERAVIFRRGIYEGLIASGWERFGSGYGQLLYIAGFDAGRIVYEELSRLFNFFTDPSLQVRLIAALFQMLGFGRLYIVRLDDEKMEAVVRVYDSFECELFRGAGEIRGNFIRGLIAGWLAARWGAEFEHVTAREEECIARGDPYCQYRIEAKA